jgi:hypothetical protein
MANNVNLNTNITEFDYKSGDKINVQNENIPSKLYEYYFTSITTHDMCYLPEN